MEFSKDNILETQKPIELWLKIGILLIPPFFAWFTLQKGRSTLSKALAFGWMALWIIYMTAGSNKNDPKHSASQTEISAQNKTIDPNLILGDAENFKSELGLEYDFKQNSPNLGLIYLKPKTEMNDKIYSEVVLSVEGLNVFKAKLRLRDDANQPKFSSAEQVALTNKFLALFGSEVEKTLSKFKAYLSENDKISKLEPQTYLTDRYSVYFSQESNSDDVRHIIIERRAK